MGALGLKIQDNREQAKTQLEALHRDLKSWQRNMEQQSETEMLQLLQKMANQSAAAAEQCLSRHKHEDVLRSLLFPEIVQRHSEIPSAHRNTFRWALKDDCTNLSQWLREGEGIYWVHGKAGSGKSTLMKFLEQESKTRDNLRIWAAGRPLVLASHYFWAIGTDIQRSLKGLLQTLLFRVFIQDPEIIPRVSPSRFKPGSYDHLHPWSLEELQQCFESLSTLDLSSRICFFIDGLDEFQGDREELVETVKSTALSKDIKLCVSSRPWRRFEKAFGQTNTWQLAVHNHTREDIHLYAQEKLNANERFRDLRRRSSDEADDLAEAVSKASDGVFLWVYLVVRQLLEGLEEYNEDIPSLKSRLKDFPTDLEDYFRRMLMTIDKAYHYESSVIFSMLITAQGQISTGLTLAWRGFVRQLSELSEHALDFAFENGLLDALKSIWDSQVVKNFKMNHPNPPTETQKEEFLESTAETKRRVSSACKDLVHVSEGEPARLPQEPGHQIGFLHRSVSDFLVLETTRKTIEDRLEPQETIHIVGLRGQAQAWLLLLQLSIRHTTDAAFRRASKGMFLRVIHLVNELYVVSSKESQLILFLLWSLVFTERNHLFWVPEMTFDVDRNLEDYRSLRVSSASEDLGESSLVARLQLILQTTTAIYSFRGIAPHERHDYLESGRRTYAWDIQTSYWASMCPHCCKNIFQELYITKNLATARTVISTYLLRFKPLLPDAHLDAFAARGSEDPLDVLIYASLPKNADLDLFENLIAALDLNDKDFERRLQNLWTVFVDAASLLSYMWKVAPPGTWEFPSNFRSVIGILVRYGAARFLRFQASGKVMSHVVSTTPNWKPLNGSPICQRVSPSSFEVDTLGLIRLFMDIPADEEDGTGVTPVQKVFDLDFGCIVSGEGFPEVSTSWIADHLTKWLLRKG